MTKKTKHDTRLSNHLLPHWWAVPNSTFRRCRVGFKLPFKDYLLLGVPWLLAIFLYPIKSSFMTIFYYFTCIPTFRLLGSLLKQFVRMIVTLKMVTTLNACLLNFEFITSIVTAQKRTAMITLTQKDKYYSILSRFCLLFRSERFYLKMKFSQLS